MSRNDVILTVVALCLIGFSLVVSLLVPRRRPDFPGSKLGLFALASVLLVGAMLATVEIYGAEEGHSQTREAGNVEDSGEPEEGGTDTSATATGETGGGTTGETGGGDAARGEQVFAESGCANCHTLKAAGASGTVGPNLDELKPDEEAVVEQVTNGGNGMPAFGDQLTPDEIAAVAAFVVQSTQG